MIDLHVQTPVVVVANGAFPTHATPLQLLSKASIVVCCDGAVSSLLEAGIAPHHIVGDLDSISPHIKERFAARLVHIPNQDTNDLTKAMQFCHEQGWSAVSIVGATGKREDHTLGNISLLGQYVAQGSVQMLTDYGVFNPVTASAQFESFPGQQVSLISLSPDTSISSTGLRYPLHQMRLTEWWQGTLNEALAYSFSLAFDKGTLLVYRAWGK